MEQRLGRLPIPRLVRANRSRSPRWPIKAQGLIKDYGSGENLVHTLRGVDAEFERGRFTVIMGPSASGKSTLTHTLAGLDTATSGHVYLNGADAERVKGRRTSRRGGQRGWST